jgi:hypothetical protein
LADHGLQQFVDEDRSHGEQLLVAGLCSGERGALAPRLVAR